MISVCKNNLEENEMFQGFYNITSGILTQNRNLNIISNNMANTATTGYKKDKVIIHTFQDELVSRIGNKVRSDKQNIGHSSSIVTAQHVVTNYSHGGLEESDNDMAFAIADKGFFVIQTENGVGYTRNGNFTIDEEGYLCLGTAGRVLGEQGPIRLGTDKIKADNKGTIYTEQGKYLGKIKVVDFGENEGTLEKTAKDLYRSKEDPNVVQDTDILWKKLETSNVNPIDEMVAMMSSQRNLQSDIQMLKIYDQLMAKIVTQITPT